MQTNTHPVSQEELMAYLDGELPFEQAASTAAHLEHCRECQALAADLQSVSRRLLEWQIEEPAFLIRARVLDSKHVQGPRKASPLLRRPWIWAAAAVLLAVAVLVPSLQQHRHGIAPVEQYAQLQRAPRFATRSGFISGVLGGAYQRAELVPPPPSQPTAPAGPLIIRTAELSLTTREFAKTQNEAERVLASYRGYIAHLSVTSPPDEGRTLDATLKVPAAQLDNLLSALRKLGRVDAESQTGEEVTRRVVDLQARLSNARNAEQRLTELLRDRSGKLSDVLAVEEQIDNVRGQIEEMQAEQESLSHQIAFASLDLKLSEEYRAPLAADRSSVSTLLRNAAIEGYQGVIAGALGVLLFLLAYGPSLLIVAAIVFFPARALWKRRKRATV